MNNFFEDVNVDKHYKYNCLIIPNWTFIQDVSKDSFNIIMSNILKRIIKIRPDISFDILVPFHVKELQLENVEQIIYDYPTYPNTMRCHFDAKKLLKVLDFRSKDYDLIYCYLPEWVVSLKNIIYNTTHHRPVIFGYSCYIENSHSEPNMINQHLLGISEMFECGTNSNSVKNELLDLAKENFSKSFINKLSKILQPIQRGWDCISYKKEKVENIIVFNHRANKYKSYDWFLEQMDLLWKQRQDFIVWVPLSETKDREYIDITKLNRQEYFQKLSTCLFGVCAESKHKGWANSASDGMSCGVPYLFLNRDYYKEYAKGVGLYYTDENKFNILCNKLLDDINYRNEISKRCLELYKHNSWDVKIYDYVSAFDNACYELENQTIDKNCESYIRVYNIIKKEKNISKKNLLTKLNWGVMIDFTKYRNLLRKEENIKFTKSGYIYNEKN